MMDLSDLLQQEDLTPAAIETVIAKLRAATLAKATKRYLLGEWARQVGLTLPRERFDELKGGPEL